MPISFIAVQCFECFTMQVKQQKKSSNKWSCVVCSQKQSVRKVFAQSFIAKDVRKFVQSFNMSRQLSDHQQSISDDEPQIVAESPKNEEQKRKRNDWTEYMENDDHGEYYAKFEQGMNSAQGDDGIEPMVVTEMPKAAFSKPKVRNYSCRGEKLLKPSFPNRRDGKMLQKEGLFLNRRVGKMLQNEGKLGQISTQSKPSFPNRRDDKMHQNEDLERDSNIKAKDKGLDLKWNSFMAQIRQTRDLATSETPGHKKIAAGKNTVSNWSSFITAEDGGDGDEHRNSESREKKEDEHFLELWVNDERVEEDIHPDFL